MGLGSMSQGPMGTLQGPPFAHLHVASAFSLRYGTAFPGALVRRAAEQGADTLALTDRDGLYGAIKHVRACHERGVRPIAGVDLALGAGPPAPGRRAVRRTPGEPARVVVLARADGWAALCRLVTAAHAAGSAASRTSRPG